LSVTGADGTSYTIYYIPASVEKNVTTIYHPEATSYEISGNNVDGFIVTVTNESK
jgi:D-alanyl-D-alanine carboxypeptidase